MTNSLTGLVLALLFSVALAKWYLIQFYTYIQYMAGYGQEFYTAGRLSDTQCRVGYITGGATNESGIPSNTQFSESNTSEKPASLMNAPWSKLGAYIRPGSWSEWSCGRVTGPVVDTLALTMVPRLQV